MSDIDTPACWHAGFVARWHAGDSAPWLAQTGDRVDGHSGRMVVLALHFWGGNASRDLIAACATHDLGEICAGDVPKAAKANPALHAVLDSLEGAVLDRMRLRIPLIAFDQARLTFLDRLDAYLWMQHHAPQLAERFDWQRDRAWLLARAEELGVRL